MSGICIGNIFSSFVTCLCIFSVVFFEKQEMLTLKKSNFSNRFIVCDFSKNSKKSAYLKVVKIFFYFSMFHSFSFIIESIVSLS